MNTALPVFPMHALFDDFLWSVEAVTASPFALVGVVTAGGATEAFETTAPADNSYTGLFSLSTGTNNNNNTKAALNSSNSNNRIKAGGGIQVIEWRARISALATVGTDFVVKVGLQDANTALGDPANGIYFYYNYNVNSGNWRGVTRNASTSTNVDSSIAVAAATWYKLRFQVNAAGTSVEFFVNDVSIGSSTGTIPTGNAMRFCATIEKQGAASTTSRTLDLDYLYYRMDR